MPAVLVKQKNTNQPQNAVYFVNISPFQDCTQKACSSRGNCFLKAKTLNTIAATKGFIHKENKYSTENLADYSHSKQIFSHHYRCCKSLEIITVFRLKVACTANK